MDLLVDDVKHDVDLLVDDVKRENAEGVVLRKRTRWTKLLEGALRHLDMSNLNLRYLFTLLKDIYPKREQSKYKISPLEI